MKVTDLKTSNLKFITPLWLVRGKTFNELKFACKAEWPKTAQTEPGVYITFISFSRRGFILITRLRDENNVINYEYVNDIHISPNSTNEELKKYLK